MYPEHLAYAVTALNDELVTCWHPPVKLIVVGGSYLTLLGLRGMTDDIDTICRLDSDMKEAIIAVALKLSIAENWLNNNAAAFEPSNFDESKCTVNLQLSLIEILLPSPDTIFIMKLYAGRGDKDLDDLIQLWPLCSFKTAKDAVSYFWEAYPGAPEDKFLEMYVQTIIDEATS
jgi:hypothetical protein